MQQMLCSVGVLLMLAEIAVVAGGYFMAVVEPRFTMTAPLPVLALACTLMAKSRIQKDYEVILQGICRPLFALMYRFENQKNVKIFLKYLD